MALNRKTPDKVVQLPDVEKVANLIPIVDADYLLYRAGFAAEYTMHHIYDPKYKMKAKEAPGKGALASFRLIKEMKAWIEESGRNDWVEVDEQILDPLPNVLHTLKLMVNEIHAKFGNRPRLFLTGKNNFRYNVAKEQEYKGNRKDSKRPTYTQEMIDYLIEYHGAEVVDGMEADDRVSTLLSRDYIEGRKFVLVAVDKDLLQVPGTHYNPVKDEFFQVTPEEGYRSFFTQLLTGDVTDNIAGIKGVGPKTAEKLLADTTTDQGMFDVVYTKYLDTYGEAALPLLRERAQLLWMLREGVVDEVLFYISTWEYYYHYTE